MTNVFNFLRMILFSVFSVFKINLLKGQLTQIQANLILVLFIQADLFDKLENSSQTNARNWL